jgi:hypothetical protein
VAKVLAKVIDAHRVFDGHEGDNVESRSTRAGDVINQLDASRMPMDHVRPERMASEAWR